MNLKLNEAEAALLANAIKDAEMLHSDNYDQLCEQGASEAARENVRSQHRMMAAIGNRLARLRAEA